MTSLLHHYWWRGLDSNQCRRKPTDLQSAPFSHSGTDRKSTRLNSSHTVISYAVFCLKKKNHRFAEALNPKAATEMSYLQQRIEVPPLTTPSGPASRNTIPSFFASTDTDRLMYPCHYL